MSALVFNAFIAPIVILMIILGGFLFNAVIDFIHHGTKLNDSELADYHQHFYKKAKTMILFGSTVFVLLLIALLLIKAQ